MNKKLEGRRWAVHVIGPDDVLFFDDELSALRESNNLNKAILSFVNTNGRSENDPFVMAVVKDLSKEEI